MATKITDSPRWTWTDRWRNSYYSDGPSVMMNREDLIAKLEERRSEAVKLDAWAAKGHEAEEKAWLKHCREVYARMAKIKDYDEMKRRRENLHAYRADEKSDWTTTRQPECDSLAAEMFDKALERLQMDTRVRYTLSNNGTHSEYYRLLFVNLDPDFEPTTGTVC